tara:strand:+ start:264 stop:401 length:138 start_codon:yes stop_codon:yes gene_type:complete
VDGAALYEPKNRSWNVFKELDAEVADEAALLADELAKFADVAAAA